MVFFPARVFTLSYSKINTFELQNTQEDDTSNPNILVDNSKHLTIIGDTAGTHRHSRVLIQERDNDIIDLNSDHDADNRTLVEQFLVRERLHFQDPNKTITYIDTKC